MNKIISDEKIYQIISKIGLIETSILDTALKTAKERKKDFATFLIKQNLIKAEEIGQLIANQLHIRFVNLAKQKVKSEILGLIPEVVARKQKMIVFGRDEEGVKIAMTNPFDYAMIKMVEKKVGDKVNPYYATQFSIDNSFSLYRKTIQQEYASSIQKHAIKAQGSAAEDISVVSLVDDLFSYAYTNHASDIHIEPADKEIIVRFRIDGILYDVLKLPKNILNIMVMLSSILEAILVK